MVQNSIQKFQPRVKVASLAKGILDLLFPFTCVGCQAADYIICPRCTTTLLGYPTVTTKLGAYKVIALSPLTNVVMHEAIHVCKYYSIRDIISEVLSLYECRISQLSSADIFVPIPIHMSRKNERGFNQSEVIAQNLAQRFSKIHANPLAKIKKTPSQVSCKTKTARLQNIKDSFMLRDADGIRNKHVVLVDDVLTTGATLLEAIRTLKSAKPKSITLFVLAID